MRQVDVLKTTFLTDISDELYVIVSFVHLQQCRIAKWKYNNTLCIQMLIYSDKIEKENGGLFH